MGDLSTNKYMNKTFKQCKQKSIRQKVHFRLLGKALIDMTRHYFENIYKHFLLYELMCSNKILKQISTWFSPGKGTCNHREWEHHCERSPHTWYETVRCSLSELAFSKAIYKGMSLFYCSFITDILNLLKWWKSNFASNKKQ